MSVTDVPVIKSPEERMAALQAEIDALKAKAADQGTSKLDAAIDKLARTLHTDRRERKEAGAYPLWKPLDFDDMPQYSYQGFERQMAQGARDALVASGASADLVKAIDSLGVGPLIRQDLDPTVYELFVKKFPLYDMIDKIPSNGEVHAYNQQTSYGDAQFITESGSVTDDANVYTRAYAEIAILATRRGITLKALNAVRAGGVAYDPETREIQGGITALVHRAQAAMFRYQQSDPTSTTATAPNGLYSPNSFNGMRWTLNNNSPAANTASVDETATYAVGQQPTTKAIRLAANNVIDAGGNPSAVLLSISSREFIVDEMLPLVRINNTVEVVPGLTVPKIVAGEAELPLIAIPGDSIGTISTGGHTYQDAYVVDMDMLAWAYLGGPAPTILEIPVGTDGTLRKLYIPFLMGGLVQFAPLFMARAQLKTS
jgi:hypothetical protein